MPATSKAQFRLMQGIAHGTIAPKGSLTKEKAAEFVSGQTEKGLPEKVKRHALHRVVNKIKKAMKGKRWRR
jgi:hypothetical protein